VNNPKRGSGLAILAGSICGVLLSLALPLRAQERVPTDGGLQAYSITGYTQANTAIGDNEQCLAIIGPSGIALPATAWYAQAARLRLNMPVIVHRARVRVSTEHAGLTAGEFYDFRVWGCYGGAAIPTVVATECDDLSGVLVVQSAHTVLDGQTLPASVEIPINRNAGGGYDHLAICAVAGDITDTPTTAQLSLVITVDYSN
jgi:hypothetical protein